MTHHQGYDPKIELTSATTAKGLWTMDDLLVFGGTLGVHGYGRYNDNYVKVNGQWVVKYSKLTRTRFDLVDPNNGTLIRANVSLAEIVGAYHQCGHRRLGQSSRTRPVRGRGCLAAG